jgi:hypothetical protein
VGVNASASFPQTSLSIGVVKMEGGEDAISFGENLGVNNNNNTYHPTRR